MYGGCIVGSTVTASDIQSVELRVIPSLTTVMTTIIRRSQRFIFRNLFARIKVLGIFSLLTVIDFAPIPLGTRTCLDRETQEEDVEESCRLAASGRDAAHSVEYLLFPSKHSN